MLYLNERQVRALGIDWNRTIDAIAAAVRTHDASDFAQPIKPYLRYGDPRNRIIAMPAYLGGDVHASGIKWIASFPGNLERGLPRAHSVVILNDADTGAPEAIINTPLLSAIRTASVSGLVLRHHARERTPSPSLRIGITGWGPIGRLHLAMCEAVLGDAIREVRVFDVRPPARSSLAGFRSRVRAVDSWQEAYLDADVFVTCTVSPAPYIDRAPKPGSLQLNVSLRDYCTGVFPYVKEAIVVDDWDEVCRERTDIETMHKECGLERAGTRTLGDVVLRGFARTLPPTAPLMFNPMGMAIFDLAIASHYAREAIARGVAPLPE